MHLLTSNYMSLSPLSTMHPMMKQLGGVQLGGLGQQERRPHLPLDGSSPTRPGPDASLKALLLGNAGNAGASPLKMAAPSSLLQVKTSKDPGARTPSPFSRMIAQRKQNSNLSLADQKMMMNCGSLDSRSSPMPMGGLLRHGAAGQSEAVRAEMNQLVGNQARLPEFRRGGHKQNHGQRKATLDVLPSIDLESEKAVPTSPSRKRNKNKSPSPARNETQSNNLSSPSSKKAKVRSASPDQKGSAAPDAGKAAKTSSATAEQLMSKCKHGRTEEVQHQLCSGFSVDAQDGEGNTLLITACQNNLKKIVKMCLENGADCSIRNDQGHDAMFYAKQQKNTSVQDLINTAIENAE